MVKGHLGIIALECKMKSYQPSCRCSEIFLVGLSEYQWQNIISQKALIKACATFQTLWGFNGQNKVFFFLVHTNPPERRTTQVHGYGATWTPVLPNLYRSPLYGRSEDRRELRNGKVTSLTVFHGKSKCMWMQMTREKRKGKTGTMFMISWNICLSRSSAHIQPFRVWTEAGGSLGRKQKLTCSPVIFTWMNNPKQTSN